VDDVSNENPLSLSGISRRDAALRHRVAAAELAYHRMHLARGAERQDRHVDNGAEASASTEHGGLPTYAESFSKGLPHYGIESKDPRPGEVRSEAYALFLKALATRDPIDFKRIPLGTGAQGRKLTSPQAGLAFDLEGPDGQSLTLPPAPRISSIDGAGEMVELYWMAYLRDVPFDAIVSGDESDVQSDYKERLKQVPEAVKELGGFPNYPALTRETLFRSNSPGARVGPYLSQFLLIGNTDRRAATEGYITYGSQEIDQRSRVAKAGLDYLTDAPSWLAVQNGEDTAGEDESEVHRRFLWTPRDLATYVHFDQLYQAYLNACLYMLAEKKDKPGAPNQKFAQRALAETEPSKVNAFPFADGIPYSGSDAQSHTTELGFATFGGPHILSLVTEVATRALKAVWFQKWFVHRRMRPEVFGARVHFAKTRMGLDYGISGQLMNAKILDLIKEHNAKLNQARGRPQDESYLLPQAFPEGSPTHPSYGAGHATVAAACVTILKAWFKDVGWPAPAVRVKPGTHGKELVELTASDRNGITVHGELNKIAANIAIGRNIGGVHYLTDYTESRTLGEQVAIGILQEQIATYNEKPVFQFNLFSGERSVTVKKGPDGGGVVTYGKLLDTSMIP
jgi:membrane-associated phospholipid phosphatase